MTKARTLADFIGSDNDVKFDTDTLYVDSSANNVGIGTSTPTDSSGFGTALDISGTNGAAVYLRDSTDSKLGVFGQWDGETSINSKQSDGSISFYINSGSKMKIGSTGRVLINSTTDNGSILEAKQQTDGYSRGFRATSITTATSYVALSMLNGTDAAVTVGSAASANTNLAFYTASSGSEAERVRIDNLGRMGINTTAPEATLHVEDIGTTGPAVYIVGGSGSEGDIAVPHDESFQLGHWNSSTDTFSERMRLHDNGTFSFGSTSSKTKALFSGSSGSGSNLGDSDTLIHQLNQGFITVENLQDTAGVEAGIIFRAKTNFAGAWTNYVKQNGNYTGDLIWRQRTGGSTSAERMRISNSGNLLVGTTNGNPTGNHEPGTLIAEYGQINIHRDAGNPLRVGRSDTGEVITFYRQGTFVGRIGVTGVGTYYGDSDVGLFFDGAADAVAPFNTNTPDFRDNAIDMGTSSARFDDIRATNGTIQTSDENEKEQIASLTDAEITAAKAISKLFKTYKWRDKVAAKGDAARTHTGMVAQQVQTAMSDAGLDVTKYAFWCSDTWWENPVEVAAIEANEAEGIEGREAYTRYDIYKTEEEAPEGSIQKTRLGLRYPELLAFIGAATEQRLTSIEARLDALET